MKSLFSTTALVVALGFPTLMLAQTTPAADDATALATDPAAQQHNIEMAGFLATRGQSDLFASELMGHDVYARRTPGEMTAAMNGDGTHDMTMMNRADLDELDNIGQITEIVLSNDGQVRALVIGVGGFLGMGEQDVAVTMDQVTFASDADDLSQMFIVVNTASGMLQDAPAYDRMMARNDAAQGNVAIGSDRTAFAAPDLEREGYNRVEVTEVSTEMLMGKSVYSVNDNDVGTVTDMIIDDSGAITDVIIDFGGFLGMGQSQASLGFDELTILSTEGYAEVRLYVDATKEQIQSLPQYQAVN